MGVREFRWRLAGLSDASRYRAALAQEPGADLSDNVGASSAALRDLL